MSREIHRPLVGLIYTRKVTPCKVGAQLCREGSERRNSETGRALERDRGSIPKHVNAVTAQQPGLCNGAPYRRSQPVHRHILRGATGHAFWLLPLQAADARSGWSAGRGRSGETDGGLPHTPRSRPTIPVHELAVPVSGCSPRPPGDHTIQVF